MTEELGIRRAFPNDAQALSMLLMCDEIAPWALDATKGHDGDVLPFLSDLRNIVLLTGTVQGPPMGAVLFHWQEAGVYEVHTCARNEIRGKRYLRAVQDALRTMFLCSDAIELYTRVPEENRAALGLVRLIHGKHEYTLAEGWRGRPTSYWALRWSDWLWGKGGLPLIARGEWFHKRLAEQYVEQDRKQHTHGDDHAHDRMVGAASELVLNGMVAKAIVLYNRWAKIAGYATVGVLVENPLVLSLGDALIQIDFEKRDFHLLPVTPSELVRAA